MQFRRWIWPLPKLRQFRIEICIFAFTDGNHLWGRISPFPSGLLLCPNKGTTWRTKHEVMESQCGGEFGSNMPQVACTAELSSLLVPVVMWRTREPQPTLIKPSIDNASIKERRGTWSYHMKWNCVKKRFSVITRMIMFCTFHLANRWSMFSGIQGKEHWT